MTARRPYVAPRMTCLGTTRPELWPQELTVDRGPGDDDDEPDEDDEKTPVD